MTDYRNESCDVLIVGGGIGGLACSVDIKEHNPEADVLVVEKNFAGYSGKANRGGGVLQYFDPNRIDPKEFVAFHTNVIGAWFTDQELMEIYVSRNTEMLDKLSSWGVNLPREEDGSYHVMPTGPMTAMICVDLDITLKVRKTAEKLGVRFLDKTVFADVITDEQGVTGATVFSVLDGTFTVINAKRVVLATGSQNYRVGSMWSSGRGDGIAAAYRAGAELRNVEFGNFAQLVKIRSHNEVVFGENFMYNAAGEHITKNFRKMRETDINSNAIQEWYKQMQEGTGPVHLDFGSDGDDGSLERLWNRPYGRKFRLLNDESGNAVDTDLEVCPMFIGEQSPIKVDHQMETTVSGLYAIGDCSYCGSGLAGAVPAPPGRNRGSGILNAVFAALQAGDKIGTDDLSAAARPNDTAQIDKTIAHIRSIAEKTEGVSAEDVIDLVQKAMAPMELSVVMKKDRMEKAEALIDQAEAMRPDLRGEDMHAVMKCLEAEAMVLSAKMHYAAAEMREESRGWFLREDFPEMDNENWLKWIIVKNVDGKMTLSTEPVPVDQWMLQPLKPGEKRLVPITEEEKAGPLYKYYEREMVEPDPKKYEMAEEAADSALAQTPFEMNKLFDPGYMPMEVGFARLPDGGATLANLTFMPGVTPEMFDFWFAWHGCEPMRYKIWNREDHYYCLTQNMDKAMDKSLDLKHRYWDTTHDVQEDCGMGKEKILINFRNPADIGFDPEKLKDFDGTIVCAGNEESPTIMCHFLRPVEGGCELRTRFWMGYHVVNGKPEKFPFIDEFPLEPVQALLKHNIKEFTNLAAILPEVFAEFGPDFMN